MNGVGLGRPPYLDRYGFSTDPFDAIISPVLTWARPAHLDAIATLRGAVQTKSALATCAADVGLGKTTLSRMLTEDLRARKIPVALFSDMPGLDRQSDTRLISAILDELKIPRAPANEAEGNRRKLADYAAQRDEEGLTTVVIIDEAHKIRAAGLRALMPLLTMQTDRSQLVQVILFGQNPELTKIIARNDAIFTRVARRVELTRFTEAETNAMIAHRLTAAGRIDKSGQPIPLFTEEALSVIARASQGIPRQVCKVSELACVEAEARNKDMVDFEVASAAVLELNYGRIDG